MWSEPESVLQQTLQAMKDEWTKPYRRAIGAFMDAYNEGDQFSLEWESAINGLRDLAGQA